MSVTQRRETYDGSKRGCRNNMGSMGEFGLGSYIRFLRNF